MTLSVCVAEFSKSIAPITTVEYHPSNGLLSACVKEHSIHIYAPTSNDSASNDTYKCIKVLDTPRALAHATVGGEDGRLGYVTVNKLCVVVSPLDRQTRPEQFYALEDCPILGCAHLQRPALQCFFACSENGALTMIDTRTANAHVVWRDCEHTPIHGIDCNAGMHGLRCLGQGKVSAIDCRKWRESAHWRAPVASRSVVCTATANYDSHVLYAFADKLYSAPNCPQFSGHRRCELCASSPLQASSTISALQCVGKLWLVACSDGHVDVASVKPKRMTKWSRGSIACPPFSVNGRPIAFFETTDSRSLLLAVDRWST
jgi:hypothetical protein